MRKPSLYKSLNGASVLKGWTPVNRISLGSLGTCESGVALSISRICGGVLAGGGRGKSGSTRIEVVDVVSSSCTVSGGDGGSCLDLDVECGCSCDSVGGKMDNPTVWCVGILIM